MRNYLYFDSMITPKIITFIYWLLLAAAVLGLSFSVRRAPASRGAPR